MDDTGLCYLICDALGCWQFSNQQLGPYFNAQGCLQKGLLDQVQRHLPAAAQLQTVPHQLLIMAFVQVPGHPLSSFPFALHLYNEPARQSVSKKMKKEPKSFGS